MANPSIGPFQNAAIEAGVKVWNYGFLDDDVMALKTGFFALNLPRFLFWGTTIGATGQYFSSPYMAENELNFLVSNHFWGIVSMGVGVGLYNRSYDQSRFDLVDADDPVFKNGTSLWSPVISAGITLMPTRKLTIAFAAKNLNSPDISLQRKGIKILPSFRFSLSYNFNGISFFGSGGSDMKDKQVVAGGSVQIAHPRTGLLMAGYSNTRSFIRGRLRVIDQFSIGYGFSTSLGEFSSLISGNHELFFSYEFSDLPGRAPALKRAKRVLLPDFKMTGATIDLVPQYVVYSPVTELEAYDVEITRKVDDSITGRILKKLNHADIVEPDSSLLFRQKAPAVAPVSEKVYKTNIHKLYTDQYIQSIEALTGGLAKQSKELFVISPPKQVKRAVSLGTFIKDSLRIRNDSLIVGMLQDSSYMSGRQKDSLDIRPYDYLGFTFPDKIPLTVYSIGSEEARPVWELIILNEKKEIIRTYSPEDAVNSVIYWNGRKTNGRTVDGGYCTYYVRWNEGGKTYESPRRYIYARKYTRKIDVRITKKVNTKTTEADKIGLILSK